MESSYYLLFLREKLADFYCGTMDPQVSDWAGPQESSSSNIKFYSPEHSLPKDRKVTFGHSLSVSHNVPVTECQCFYLIP